MEDHTSHHDTDDPVVHVNIELRLPRAHAAAFAEAMTGNDDDVLLAAETAMRERIGRDYSPFMELELSYFDRDTELRGFIAEEGRIERRCVREYGPRAKA